MSIWPSVWHLKCRSLFKNFSWHLFYNLLCLFVHPWLFCARCHSCFRIKERWRVMVDSLVTLDIFLSTLGKKGNASDKENKAAKNKILRSKNKTKNFSWLSVSLLSISRAIIALENRKCLKFFLLFHYIFKSEAFL